MSIGDHEDLDPDDPLDQAEYQLRLIEAQERGENPYNITVATTDSTTEGIFTGTVATTTNNILEQAITGTTTGNVTLRTDPIVFGNQEGVEVKKKVPKKKVLKPPTPKPVVNPRVELYKHISDHETLTDFQRDILDIVDLSFDRDDYDIGFPDESTTSYKVLILRWKEFIITNKRDETHRIKDMLVAMPFSSNGERFDQDLRGTRGSISYKEYKSRYRHSHLNSGFHPFSTFCTGRDGINNSWSELRLSTPKEKGVDEYSLMFESFLHQLNSFIRYESIEGTPYIYIQSLSYGHSSRASNSNIVNSSNNFYKRFKESDIELAMDFNSGDLELIETDELHTEMAMYANKHQNRLPTGDYVDLGTSPEIKFDGDKLPYKYFLHGWKTAMVDPYVSESSGESDTRKYAHKLIVQHIKNVIEENGKTIIRNFCEKEAIRIQNEENGFSSNRKRFSTRHSLLPIEETELRVVGTPVLED